MTLLPRTFTWAPVPICLLNILTLISSEHLKLIVSQPSFSQSSPSQCWQPHHCSCCSRPAAFDLSLLSTQHSIYGHVHAAINIDPQSKTLHHLHCYQQASSIPSENIEIPTFAFLLLCLSSLLCLHSFFLIYSLPCNQTSPVKIQALSSYSFLNHCRSFLPHFKGKPKLLQWPEQSSTFHPHPNYIINLPTSNHPLIHTIYPAILWACVSHSCLRALVLGVFSPRPLVPADFHSTLPTVSLPPYLTQILPSPPALLLQPFQKWNPSRNPSSWTSFSSAHNMFHILNIFTF